jgi:hypothetical protein
MSTNHIEWYDEQLRLIISNMDILIDSIADLYGKEIPEETVDWCLNDLNNVTQRLIDAIYPHDAVMDARITVFDFKQGKKKGPKQ